jgi:hypothetical protein|tara:strand:+ start:5230 stop:5379 length:150 start_codon:yes stop_codon:yes gene_type:complete
MSEEGCLKRIEKYKSLGKEDLLIKEKKFYEANYAKTEKVEKNKNIKKSK